MTSAKRVLLWICLIAATLGFRPGPAQDLEDELDLTRLLGIVSEVKDGGTFVMKARQGGKGKWEVKPAPEPEIFSYTSKKLGDIESGATLHVLGRYQPSQPGPSGGNTWPEILSVQCILVGKSFKPPPVPSKLASAKYVWRTGKVRRVPSQKQNLFIGDTAIRCPLSKVAVKRKESDKSGIKKKSALVVEGLAEEKERKKPRGILCSRIHVLPLSMIKDRSYELFLKF